MKEGFIKSHSEEAVKPSHVITRSVSAPVLQTSNPATPSPVREQTEEELIDFIEEREQSFLKDPGQLMLASVKTSEIYSILSMMVEEQLSNRGESRLEKLRGLWKHYSFKRDLYLALEADSEATPESFMTASSTLFSSRSPSKTSAGEEGLTDPAKTESSSLSLSKLE